jgi:hypothetical protein
MLERFHTLGCVGNIQIKIIMLKEMRKRLFGVAIIDIGDGLGRQHVHKGTTIVLKVCIKDVNAYSSKLFQADQTPIRFSQREGE